MSQIDSEKSSRVIILQCINEVEKTKKVCEAAIAQLSDEQLHIRINPHQNSIAVIMQHLSGNMVSRFTDFLTTDGEKPNRNREGEFQDRQLSRSELMALWNQGWKTFLDAMNPLTDADLQRAVKIRNEPLSVFQVIARHLSHYAYHCGQIVLIGKHIIGERWNYLTVPPGKSEEFNRKMGIR